MNKKYYVTRTGQYVWTVSEFDGSDAQEFRNEAGAIQHCIRMNGMKVQVAELDLYGSATRVNIDGQTISVRHSAIISHGRIAKTVRGLIVSVSVPASVKKMIADAIKTEARKQTRELAA